MIESFNDWIALVILVGLMGASAYLVLKVFFYHRQKKLIEEEIEYYQDW